METPTPFPQYKLLAAGNSFVVKKNLTVAVILSSGASATWEAQNGSTGIVSVSMVLGPYTQSMTITAVAGNVELIVNGNVQLTGDGSAEILEATDFSTSAKQQQILDELESIRTKLDEGRLNVSLEDFSVVMRNILMHALTRTSPNSTFASSFGNVQKVALTTTGGTVVGDNLTLVTNVNQFAGLSVREALFTPTDRILWSQSVRSKIS